jgi:phage repressor protein C with HTH and peptisase S24 domain
MEININQRFKDALNACLNKGIVQNKADFAQKINITASRLSEITGGRMGVSSEICNSMYQNFGINLNWLISSDGEMFIENNESQVKVISHPIEKYGRDFIKIPIMDVSGAAGITGYINQDNIDTVEYIVLPKSMLKSNSLYVCVKNKGESMSPTFYDYDKLVIRLLDRSEWANMNDEHIHFIVHRDGGSYIKRIKNRLKKGFLVCMSDNVDKLSFPNFNIDHNDLLFIWHVDLHISAKMPNINDTYYHRIKNVEDRLDELTNKLKVLNK